MTVSAGVISLGKLYGRGNRMAAFAAEHVDTLKGSDNPVASRCGEVLERIIEGFGIGETTGLALIGVGQLLLGNPVTAPALVASTANPVVLTCAAIGAVHYGWGALSEKEKQAIVDKAAAAFALGAELVRSIIRFALDTLRTLLSRENLTELRNFVAQVAALCGKRMSEITGAISDRAGELAQSASALAADGFQAVSAYLPGRSTN